MGKNNLVICPNQHYYDADKYSDCPYCADRKGFNKGMNHVSWEDSIGKTEKISSNDTWGVQSFNNSPTGDGSTVSMGDTAPAGNPWDNFGNGNGSNGVKSEEDITIALPQYGQNKSYGFSPVVGWLICIDGAAKGKDYRLHSGYNYIGRHESMDVYIEGDNHISRKRHAMIGYEPKAKIFLLAPVEGHSFIYLNDQYIMGSTQLNAYDIIQIGVTKLMFVPLCGEKFNWE